jgi:hypothetical protein
VPRSSPDFTSLYGELGRPLDRSSTDAHPDCPGQVRQMVGSPSVQSGGKPVPCSENAFLGPDQEITVRRVARHNGWQAPVAGRSSTPKAPASCHQTNIHGQPELTLLEREHLLRASQSGGNLRGGTTPRRRCSRRLHANAPPALESSYSNIGRGGDAADLIGPPPPPRPQSFVFLAPHVRRRAFAQLSQDGAKIRRQTCRA